MKKKNSLKLFIKSGKKGGERTKALYGIRHFQMAGKKSGESRRQFKEFLEAKSSVEAQTLPQKDINPL